jgi:hypothetical protein
MEEERISVSKDTQKFLKDMADLPRDKYEKAVHLLPLSSSLMNQAYGLA